MITLDFMTPLLEPGARARFKLTLEKAKEIRAALDHAIIAAEIEGAEVRAQRRRASDRSNGILAVALI